MSVNGVLIHPMETTCLHLILEFLCISTLKGNWRKGKFYRLKKLTYKNGTIKETVFIDGNSSCDIMKYTTEDFTIFGKFDEKLVPQGITYRIDCIGNIFHGFLNTEEGGKELKNFDYQEGILYTIGGDKYEGVFFANMLHGQGRCIQSNGDILIGEFQFGRLHGYGKCEFNNKDIYIGNWNQGVIEGEGEIWYGTLQERYKGYFIKALPHGSGTLFLKNGDVYEGEFFKGMMSGKGKYNSIEENYIYEGEFVRNKKYGKGFENFIGKETYCGDFVEGKRSGKGILVKENTETYKGEFKNNLFHGEGILITKKGQEIAGKFEKGVLVKEGKNKDCLIF